VAEWYQYTGHFVRTNVRFEKRGKRGWVGEIDILACLLLHGIVSHIEKVYGCRLVGGPETELQQEVRQALAI
jgi:hypothetical protein